MDTCVHGSSYGLFKKIKTFDFLSIVPIVCTLSHSACERVSI